MTRRDKPAVPGEFDIIRRYFAPLAENFPGSLALSDDAALITPDPGCEIVVTVDAMVAGVHFLPDDPPGDVARKLLRVNLSDLAAMGADPLAYVLTTAWPRDIEESWIAGFADGLRRDQDEFEISLAGGDTVATDGPLTLTLTAMGQVPAGLALKRAGAAPGDAVFVSGTIGDAGAGLLVAKGEAGQGLSEEDKAYLIGRYRLPRPRLELGLALRRLAGAVVDVSDGLLADLGHIVEASGVGAEINLPAVPVSAAAARCLDLLATVTCGDDYELLLTVPAARRGLVSAAAREAGIALSEIGRITAGSEIVVLDENQTPVSIPLVGYRHF